LNKLDFNLATSCFLVSFGLVVVIIVISRVNSVVVLDERVFVDLWEVLRRIAHGPSVHFNAATLLSCTHTWVWMAGEGDWRVVAEVGAEFIGAGAL
jgi:hypothetical protein